MTLHIISDALQQRVTAHLSQFGTLARSVLWTGRGSIVVHFAEPITTSATDTRFAPLTVNWASTFRATDGAIYLNVPAAWRRDAAEGESNSMGMMGGLSEPQRDAMDSIREGRGLAHVHSQTLNALLARNLVEQAKFGEKCSLSSVGEVVYYEHEVMQKQQASDFVPGQPVQWLNWNITPTSWDYEWVDATIERVTNSFVILRYTDGTTNRRVPRSIRHAAPAPIIDPIAPIPANELENADEPHDDIGTLVSDEAPLTLPDAAVIEAAKPAAPYAWATPERRAEVRPILEKLTPIDLYPSKTEGVWLIEDAVTEKTMRRGLAAFKTVRVLGIEPDEMDGEPYCIARFTLNESVATPYPSKRQTQPIPDTDSIYAQYELLRAALPPTTFLLIQVNGDQWLAFTMDAMLLRRYAPLCRFTACSVNNAGEQWDKLEIPAGLIDETLTNANEAGLTVALAAITRDEPGKLPLREVTEIHAPGQPVQYVGKEESPTEADEEADVETTEVAPIPTAVPSKLEMTPELMAAKIKLHIHGGLRLGRLGIIRQLDRREGAGAAWFDVFFIHPVKPYIVEALEAHYDIESASGHIVTLRPKTAAPLGDVQAQAEAVVSALPDLTPAIDAVHTLAAALSDAQARVDEFVAERDLIAALKLEHADIDAATFGITHFLLNVIAKMRAVEAARVY